MGFKILKFDANMKDQAKTNSNTNLFVKSIPEEWKEDDLV